MQFQYISISYPVYIVNIIAISIFPYVYAACLLIYCVSLFVQFPLLLQQNKFSPCWNNKGFSYLILLTG